MQSERSAESERREHPPDGIHIVEQGEWLSSIAAGYGLAWQRVWDAPENRALVSARQQANVLKPGDRVFIPAHYSKAEECHTGRRHCFLMCTPEKAVRVILADENGNPRSNLYYFIETNDGARISGMTAEDGSIRIGIREGQRALKLSLGNNQTESYEINIGHLDPLDEITGYQQRLFNLDFYPGRIDGEDGPLTQAAIRAFQLWENEVAQRDVLLVDGKMGPKTKASLQTRHGY